MKSSQIQSIVVDDVKFLWVREHIHRKEMGCTEEIRIYLEGYKSSFLRLRFVEKDEWQVGYPDAGVIWSRAHDRIYNLNRPKIIAQLIKHFYGTRWNPSKSRSSIIVENAIDCLADIEDELHVIEQEKDDTYS